MSSAGVARNEVKVLRYSTWVVLTRSSEVRFQLTTFTCNEVVLFVVTLVFISLLSFTSRYFRYLFSHNIAYDLRDNWYSCCKLSLQVVTNLCIFDEFMVNKYILIWCGIEMSFVRMLTFGIHILVDAYWYSGLVIILPTYFWRLTLLYNVSAEASVFF